MLQASGSTPRTPKKSRSARGLEACGAALLFAAACTSSSVPPASPSSATAPSAKVDVTWSDPAEYQVPHISEEAGEAIFARIGVGDPYRTGLPYPVFLAMLSMYPDVLGDSVQAFTDRFGFTPRAPDPQSADRDARDGLPVGMHLTDDPNTHVPFLVHSCAVCHSQIVRWPGGEKLVIGIGSRSIRIHAFDDALAKIAARPDFDREHVGPVARKIAQDRDIPWSPDYRDAVVGVTIRTLKERGASRAQLLDRVRDGLPGRVATIESFGFALGQLLHHDVAASPTVGWAKIPDAIGFGQRRTLSWDGGSEGPSDAIVIDADIAAGARVEWYVKHPWQGPAVAAYLRHLQRDLRFPQPVDPGLARQGKAIFDRACAKCHGTYEDDGRAKTYVERIVPLEYVDTDPARTHAVTDAFVSAANDPQLTLGLVLETTRRTEGYVPPVLTSVWARAPYGHAGQWPNLEVLATKPAQRPSRFVVHAGAPLDLAKVGLSTGDPDAPLGPGDYLQDGTKEGLHVSGHPFLADLGGDAKAVIEYLKTL
jgi:hypothetical protein